MTLRTKTRIVSVIGLGAIFGCCFVWLWAQGEAFEKAVSEGMQSALEPINTMTDFQGNLRVHNYEAAYNLATNDFQQRVSFSKFIELVELNPQIRGEWTDLTQDSFSENDNEVMYIITAETDLQKTSTFRLRLRKTSNKWLIDSIFLP